MLGDFGITLERDQVGGCRDDGGVGEEYDMEGLHPLVALSRKVYEKGVALSKEAMHAVEARLARHPELPKWDMLIRPAST